jgi:hypothetical protein
VSGRSGPGLPLPFSKGRTTRSPVRFDRTGAIRARGLPRLVTTIPSSGRCSNSERHCRRNSVTLRSLMVLMYTEMYISDFAEIPGRPADRHTSLVNRQAYTEVSEVV